jgi:hypothetical protein
MLLETQPGRRLGTTLTWPLGMAWTTWHYLWRILPVYREEEEGSVGLDLPPALPNCLPPDGVLTPDDGVGPLLHRVYSGRITGACLSAEALMTRVSADPNRITPRQIARFHKVSGRDDLMQAGDEFLVHMPGPWNGPVRTVEVRPNGFRFATLSGHLEAGQIEWRARAEDVLTFTIESWARGGDRLSAILHDRLRMAKEVQLYMWTTVVERAARLAGGRLENGVRVRTRRVPPEAFAPQAGSRGA